MHIRPRNEITNTITSKIPPLPKNKTVVQVLADFLSYLFRCAKDYILVTHANGRDLWDSVEEEIEFVVSHPNGWEGYQQKQMRDASVLAGFIQDSPEGHARVSFVTEGEASLHFSIHNGLPDGVLEVRQNGIIYTFISNMILVCDSDLSLQREEGVVIVDAGGGTIDISTYSRRRKHPSDAGIHFEEIAAPQCEYPYDPPWSLFCVNVSTDITIGYFFGSVFVSTNARQFLQSKHCSSNPVRNLVVLMHAWLELLGESDYLNDLDDIVRCFDRTTKIRFSDDKQGQYIKFGSTRDNDPSCGIRFGQLKISG